ncbi:MULTISPECIES: LysR family transcriptional regulator [Schumannella]|uniref:DNA-binding transcriptional LysR family regulator n=2 Tax=Schumannella TaxID=472058 RepID=A0A852YK05_9MICO|nr:MULTISPECIES: LysR family transcriptional regulator [Schumannella]NYG99498.1 DNA-binding transcriptional LysR family regulator [Schumannella luteola]TPW75847.1 LysR family transcriptional regulator [Schumannella soli]TPX03823.1 LysR family transcriptional regulator [Schumannella luteola]
MDVRRLDLLRELADRGSVTAVARATHRTPSAVSQQLKALEREVGVPLTERSGRGLVLTGPGRVLADTAKDLAAAIQRAESVWAEFLEQPRGEVTLVTFPTAGEMLLPGVLHRIDAVPGLTLACRDLDPLLPDFADLTPDFDIVIADAPGIAPSWRERGLTVVELLREPLDIVLPEGHPLAAKRSLSPADVVDETWIGVPEDFPYDRILDRIQAITGHEARIAQRFIDNSIVEAVIAAGHGIGILPRYTTRDRENGLVTRPLSGVRSERVIWAILRSDRAERPSVRLVLDALQAEAADFAAKHRPA